MQIFRCILYVFVYISAFIQCISRHNLYTGEHENQLLSILKYHDIIPDILDDVLETSSLEVCLTILTHFAAFFYAHKKIFKYLLFCQGFIWP